MSTYIHNNTRSKARYGVEKICNFIYNNWIVSGLERAEKNGGKNWIKLNILGELMVVVNGMKYCRKDYINKQ